MTNENDARLIAQMTALRAELAVARRRELFWRVFVLAVVATLAFLLNDARVRSDEQDRIIARQDQIIEDIVDARAASREATCEGFQAFTDALVAAAEADPETVAAFVGDLNDDLAAIDCTIQVHVP